MTPTGSSRASVVPIHLNMTDAELIAWLSTHPVNSYWDGLGDEEWTLTTFASIGRGPDYRSALLALIESDSFNVRRHRGIASRDRDGGQDA
jgi:hypothetical protein